MVISFHNIDVDHLSTQEQKLYRPLIDKEFWPCLKGKNPKNISDVTVHAIAAFTSDERPCGIVIALFFNHTRHAKLLTIGIEKLFWEQDLPSQLLLELHKTLQEKHCIFLNFIYSEEMAHLPLLTASFQKLGWGPPSLFMVRLHFKVAAFNAPWLKFAEEDPPRGLQLFPWRLLQKKEKEVLEHQMAEGVFPVSLSPFNMPQLEPMNSFGIRSKEGVIGWILTTRLHQDTIDYANFYIDREHRGTKIGMYLLAKSILRQKDSSVPNSLLEINLGQVDLSWVAFAKKRLQPYTERVERLYEIVWVF